MSKRTEKAIKADANELQTMLEESVDDSRRDRLINLTYTLLAMQSDRKDETDKVNAYNRQVANSLSGNGKFPHYEPFRPSVAEHERINFIQNNLRILTAQTRAIDVVPTWQNTEDEVISKARSAWWTWRSTGMDEMGGWKTDLDNAFSDFSALGEGSLRPGIVKAETGYAVTVTHYHPLNVLTDPFAKYTNESRFTCFSTIYGMDEAYERFPDFDFEQYGDAEYKRTGIQLSGVRVIEYFAKKSKSKGQPSYMAIAGSLTGTVILEEDNPFADTIPHQNFLGWIPSGSDVPIGMVQACLYIQQELERMDDDARRKSMRDNLLGLLPSMFHKDDMLALAKGKRPQFMRLDESFLNKWSNTLKEAFFTVPRNGENSDQKERRAEFHGMMQQLSGISTLDMGQISGNDPTAREVSEASSRGQAQTGFYASEWGRGIQELAPKVGRIARVYDSEPFCVNDDGIPVWYNVERDARLTSQALFAGPLNAVVDRDALMMTDVNMKRARESQKWLGIFEISRSPEAWRQYLLAQGIKNPEDFPLPAPDPLAGAPGNPAAPV